MSFNDASMVGVPMIRVMFDVRRDQPSDANLYAAPRRAITLCPSLLTCTNKSHTLGWDDDIVCA